MRYKEGARRLDPAPPPDKMRGEEQTAKQPRDRGRSPTSGPAVPIGSVSCEQEILIPSFTSYSAKKFIITWG